MPTEFVCFAGYILFPGGIAASRRASEQVLPLIAPCSRAVQAITLATAQGAGYTGSQLML